DESEPGPVFDALVLWDVTTGKKCAASLRGETYCLDHVAFSTDCRLLALRRSDGHFCVHNAATGKVRRVLGAGDGTMTTAPLFTPDGRTLITAVEKEVVFWEIASGRPIVRREGHLADVRGLVLSPDGQR